jgi:protocatechuate 4,5-dioxygenase beta chain
MPLGLGMASSHAPGMFRKAEDWPKALERMPDHIRNHLPYTAKLEVETPGIIEGYIERIEAAFATMRAQLEAYKPDALIMIGDDQGDMFGDENNPIFSVYTGDEPIWGVGYRDVAFNAPVEARPRLTFPQHTELARYLQKGLVKHEFDVANLGKFQPRGPTGRGVSHMVSALVPEVNPRLDIPLVCVFINEYYPPLPSAGRCAALGEAIADVLKDRPERVAIYASGGISHFPGEYNVGWIDQALDHWILERLEANDLEAMENLFTFDSDNLRAGTGEVRAWISVMAAMKRPAVKVDYVPAHCTVTGCGWVYWPPVESAPAPAERATVAATA